MSSISSGALIIPSLDRGTPASEERRHQFRHFRPAIRCPPLPTLLPSCLAENPKDFSPSSVEMVMPRFYDHHIYK